MPTSLTDQMFGEGEEISLTDQIFASQGQRSLTDQIFGEAIVPDAEAPDVSGIAKGLAAESLRGAGIGKGTIQGAYMTELLAPSVTEDPISESIFKATKDALVNSAKAAGMNVVAAGELAMNIASSMLLYIPSKLYGVMALPFGREVADIAEEEMARLGYQPQTEEGKRAAEMVGKGFELFLTPARNVGEVVSKLNPEVGYLVEFGAELAEFIMTGGVVKGVRAKFKPGVKQATKILEAKRDLELDAINEKQKVIEGIPNEVIKETQRKVLEVEEVQAELKHQEMLDKLDYGQMIREDLGSKGKQIRQIKQPKKEIVDEVVDKALEKVPEEKVVEPVTDLDLQTGTPKPPLLSTEKSPFRETPEHTQMMSDAYTGRVKNIMEDPEVATAYYINRVNSWLDRKDVPIDEVRNSLSELAARSEEVKNHFDDFNDFLKWQETVGEAAEWARKADRLKIEPTERALSQAESLRIIHDHIAKTVGTDNPQKVVDFYTKKFNIKRPVKLTIWGEPKERDPLLPRRAGSTLHTPEDHQIGVLLDKGDSRILGVIRHEMEHIKDVESGRKPEGRHHIEYKDFDLEFAQKVVGKAEGVKLYTGVPLDEAAKAVISGARKVSEYTRKARGMKAFRPVAAAKILKEEFTRSFVDRSGNIRKALLDKLGDDGYTVVQKMYLTKGASSLSANMLKQMRKEVYSGLSKAEKKILDDVILDDRMLDLAKYKTEKEFKHPEGLTPTNFAEHRELFQYKSTNEIMDLTPERAADISRRAKAYFEWMKRPLKDMLEAELISGQEYSDLVAHNYRRIKLVDIYDKRYRSEVGGKKRTVYDSGVESLARGRETDIYEPSSEIMALEVFNRAYGRILNNKANQSLLDLARKDPENPFVRIREKKGDKIPSGWDRVFVYEKGERKSIYLSPEMSKEWITSSPEMSYRLSQIIRYASGSAVLRTFATGINWGFALANLPRDIMHTWYAARVFENGKWKPIYNPNLPIFAMQIGRDLATVFTDAALRKGRYEQYIKEGGGMEFLVHQGRLFQRGRHVEGSIDAVYDFMGYFGETSEVMTRLAIRERVLRKGKSSQEATFAARDYMDFGQGGGIAKALDNGIPYLNAAIQGTRGMFRAFKDNPISSTYKLSQFAALVSGLYIAMQKMHPESSKGLKGNIDMQNNICVPLGDNFGFEDDRGQMRYPYLKFPLDPGQKFFKTFFEGATDKWLGNEVDVDRIVDSLKEQSPVGVTELPPSISGVLGYVTNKDFWLNEDIWRKTDKPFGWPESREEYIPGKTPQAYIDLGATTGLSPERTKFAVEELVTSGTVWSYLLGQGYDAALGDLPKSKKEQHLAEVLSKIPVVRRFFGVTNPYSQFAQPIDKAEEKSDIDRWVQNRGLDMRVEGYLYDKNVERKEIIDYMKSFKDKDVYDRLKDRFIFQEKTKGMPNRSFWLRLKSLTLEARARIYIDEFEKDPEQVMEGYNWIIGRDKKGMGVLTKSFREEVMKLRGVK